jgi:hypothetical protein
MMAYTPTHVIKTRIVPRTAYFTRRGYEALIVLPDRVLDSCNFYGNHGRKVRAEAVAWAHERAERLAREHRTAWQDVRTSANSTY